MLQEMQMLVEHNIRMYCINLLFNYRISDSSVTECFYINLTEDLQHRTQLEKHLIQDLIKFLQKYLNEFVDD